MSPSITQIVVVLVIIALLFGGSRLRHLGSDLGESIKGFKKAIKDEDKPAPNLEEDEHVVDTEVDKENASTKD